MSDLSTKTGKAHLAVVANVNHVIVTVVPEGQAEQTRTIVKAQLSSGSASVTFSGLPEGSVSVTARAYNSEGRVIGEASKTASIVNNQTTQVALPVSLEPTVIVATPTPSPTPGSLAANVTLTDGPTITVTPTPTPTPEPTLPDAVTNTFAVGSNPGGLVVDAVGNLWVTANRLLRKISPSGAELGAYNVGEYPSAVWLDQSGNILAFSVYPDKLVRVNTNGVQLGTYPIANGSFNSLQFDASGQIWALSSQPNRETAATLFQYSANFEIQNSYSVSTYFPNGLLQTATGDFWTTQQAPVAGANASQLVKISKNATPLKTIQLPGSTEGYPSGTTAPVFDSNGNIWLGQRYNYRENNTIAAITTLRKFSNDGTLIGSYPLGKGYITSMLPVDDSVWIIKRVVGTTYPLVVTSTLLKIGPDGTTLNSFA